MSENNNNRLDKMAAELAAVSHNLSFLADKIGAGTSEMTSENISEMLFSAAYHLERISSEIDDVALCEAA